MKILLYTNILTPYRKYFYDLLNERCRSLGHQFGVLVMAETEGNRPWKYYDYATEYTSLLSFRTFSRGETYIHFNHKLCDKLITFEPDLVVVAGSYLCPGAWVIAKNKKKLNYKCLFWSESHLNERKNNGYIKNYSRELIRKNFYKLYDGFWYAGKMSKEFIMKYAQKDSFYCFVPNLIDESIYKAAQFMSAEEKMRLKNQYNLESNKKILFCPARLSPVKGILEFLDILEKVSINENIVFLIAGEGELRDSIQKVALDKGLDVRLLGNKNQMEIVGLYAISDVFVLPSLSDPNPLSCIEALWAGLPLFISEHCGNFPEVVENGTNGFVFSYSNLDSASTMLTNVLSTYESMGQKSALKAIEQYNSKLVTERIINDCLFLNGIE